MFVKPRKLLLKNVCKKKKCLHIWKITGISHFISSRRYYFITDWKFATTLHWASLLCHFPTSICSPSISVPHFANSNNSSSFLIIVFVMLIHDQWSLLTLGRLWLAESLQVLATEFSFSNKVFLCVCLFKAYISHLFLCFEHNCFPKYYWCQLQNFSPWNCSSWPWNAILFCENEYAPRGPGVSCTFHKAVQAWINQSMWDRICIWYAL